jgi:hypothetical protein
MLLLFTQSGFTYHSALSLKLRTSVHTNEAFILIQGVHMKCIPFYCNITHELKGTGMKTKRIWVGYMIKFL